MDSANANVMGMKGGLVRISPSEPSIAFVFSVRDAIRNGAGEEVLMKRSKLALTATAQFEVALPGGEDQYWRSQNVRQERIEIGDVAQLSVRQWIYDVIGFRESKERELEKKLAASAVAKMCDEHVRYARSSERITDAFVDSALTIHKRLLSIPAATELLLWPEEHMMIANPFKSIFS